MQAPRRIRPDTILAPGLTALLLALTLMTPAASAADKPWVVYEGDDGPGQGTDVVLVSGDEEYRSEETLPQLGKILAERHGFRCTVLFAINPKTGKIDPEHQSNIPGLHHLRDADLMVLFTRFRDLPNEQMKYIDRYIRSGRPVVGLRTATHAFQIPEGEKYHRYDWRSKVEGWNGGFGRQVLGETWVAHHGAHKKQSTRGIIPDAAKGHPILRGIESGEIWGPTDVYKVRLPLPGDSEPLVLGQVLQGMKPSSKPVQGGKNNPMMPVAWTKTYDAEQGTARVFTSTMGASVDFENAALRRLIVNACYWTLGMEDAIPKKSDVGIVGDFDPTFYGFGNHQEGLTPDDFRMEDE